MPDRLFALLAAALLLLPGSLPGAEEPGERTAFCPVIAAANAPAAAKAPAQATPAPRLRPDRPPGQDHARRERTPHHGTSHDRPRHDRPRHDRSSHQGTPNDRTRRRQPLTLSQLIRKYPDVILASGPRQRQIALTFDDVPDPRFTPAILDVLKAQGVKATFFIVGNRAEKHPGLVARIVREGHSIGNHSYSHPVFTRQGLPAFRSQILRTEDILKRTAGYRPRLIRPPYGEITEKQLRWARSHGYRIIYWNVDSQDWRGLNKRQVERNILPRAGRGAIVLQHGGGGVGSDLSGTIKALPDIIRIMGAKGYRFVTVPEMLHLPERQTGSPVRPDPS